jgi:pyruvyl transferase EpsO
MDQQEKVLDALKEELRAVAQVLSGSTDLVYVDYPVHDNVGDQLINLGTEIFFAEHGLNVKARLSINDLCWTDLPDGRPVVPRVTFRALDKLLQGNTYLVCHGGGNFGTLYQKYNAFRLYLLSRYPSTRIVVLPQTVHFEDELAERHTLEAFRRHGNAFVFARDSTSLESLRSAGVPSRLSPDMAHALWRSAYFSLLCPEGTGHLVLARRDKERRLSLPNVSGPGSIGWVDWSDFSENWESEFVRVFSAVQRRNPFLPRTSGILQIGWYRYRDFLVRRAIAKFGQVRTVYTDRLHAVVLAALLGKETFFTDNSYGKLGNYWNDWFRDSGRVHQIDNLPVNGEQRREVASPRFESTGGCECGTGTRQ